MRLSVFVALLLALCSRVIRDQLFSALSFSLPPLSQRQQHRSSTSAGFRRTTLHDRQGRSTRVTSRALLSDDDFSLDELIEWLPLPSEAQAAPAESQGKMIVPLLPVVLPPLPGAEVSIAAENEADSALYDDLLLSGSRMLVAVARDEDGTKVSEFGTLLYLEELQEVSGATDGAAKFLAKLTAVGRARVRGFYAGGQNEWREPLYYCAEVESITDEEDASNDVSELKYSLEKELLTLARFQRNQPSMGIGEVAAVDMMAALASAERDPEEIALVQGLWRTTSGTKIRIAGREVRGLGILGVGDDGDFTMQLATAGAKASPLWQQQDGRRIDTGGRVYRASPGRDEGTKDKGSFTTLSWCDGDVWTRIASRPPFKFDVSGTVGVLWRAAALWQEKSAFGAEALRRASRVKAADAIAKEREKQEIEPDTPLTPEQEELWIKSQLEADIEAKEVNFQKTVLPSVALLSAPSQAARVKVLAHVVALESTRLRLRLTLQEGEGMDSETSD
mmetsp:Transcript_51491/g.122450  ORF Transcript_51491/g.122450 Transcript_51491/m.122450 type:complete len:506 (-) Transcript_51491:7-1524(-)